MLIPIVSLLFALIIVVVLVISVIVSFYYENLRSGGYQKKILFHKHHNLLREEFDEKLISMTLDEYIDYRKNKFSKIASFVFKTLGTSDLQDFGLKMEYYWDCKKEIDQYQSEILMLWDEFFTIMNKKLHSYDDYRRELLFLAKLTRLSNINEEIRNELDTKLLDFIDFNYPQGTSTSFYEKFDYLLGWAYFRVSTEYLDIMMLGVSIREVDKLKHFWNNFESDFMKLRNESPTRSKHFYFIIRNCFDRFEENNRFEVFYKEISVWVMEIFNNEDNGKEFSEVLIRYKRVARKNKKGFSLFFDYVLDYTTRYGEKPHLLIYYYLAFILIFTFLYYPFNFSIFEFEGIEKEDYWLTSIINLIYFNFTTMISNSYGNISPENEVTKIFVIGEQLLGFVLSGGFIALFLRKIFRN